LSRWKAAIGQLEPLEKDKGGLDAAIGEKELTAELRQGLAIFHHGSLLLPSLLMIQRKR
jgi:hypothetical protein